jgi:hypothetical protein
MIDICHKLGEEVGPSTQVATRWLPSGYQAAGIAANPEERFRE